MAKCKGGAWRSDAGDSARGQGQTRPSVARALQREAAMAEEHLVQRARRDRIRDGEIELMKEVAHAREGAAARRASPESLPSSFDKRSRWSVPYNHLTLPTNKGAE